MKSNLITKFIPFMLLITVYSQSSSANEHRIGLSLGGIAWGNGLLSLSYDQSGLFTQKNWSLGAELGTLWHGFVIAPRALYWQNKNMSGFYGGPKALVGFASSRNYHYYCYNCENRNHTFVGLGGEGGWLYRFKTEPKGLDLGGGIDVVATNYHIWASLKFTVGYLIP
ncbi:hypothetical protein [Silvanigrella aquatica]|uniref:Uncharacterized protein n=1 Tax=Silvanigrella aquatica TaxID=1915309 RepID=A0A1L4CX09_9BACT|nr:hypothetical protein [Silvanigrella aquatica]APJ02488.1 hypothetical protein AXG55_00475 [Silvanigrella aquatica]